MNSEFERKVHERVFEERLLQNAIQLGIPIRRFTKTFGVVVPPEQPHVFFCDSFYTIDNDNKLIEELNGVMVMLGHGLRIGSTVNQWIFRGTGLSVEETYRKYSLTAQEMNMAPLDVVVSCKPSFSQSQTKQIPLGFLVINNIPPCIASGATSYIISNNNFTNSYEQRKGVSLPVTSKQWDNISRWNEYWNWHKHLRTDEKIPRATLIPKIVS